MAGSTIDYAGPRAARAPARRAEAAGLVAFLRRLDWLLVAGVGVLVAYGLYAISGITRNDVAGDEQYFVVRQGIAVGLGLAALGLALAIDPDRLRRLKRPIYAGTAAIMVFVFVAGVAAHGSRRWVDIGPFEFQPSEFGKLLFVLALAAFLADRGRRVGEWSTVLATVGLGLVPIALVFIQPDLGTALVYGSALAAVLFVSGTRWLHLGVLGVLAAIAIGLALWGLPAAGVQVLKPYQAQRLTGFTDPASDPQSATYNVNQSMTAVGAGGLRGRGISGATQTRFGLLPVHSTDFAFASLAEQRGFLGCAILLCLYLLVVWRGLRTIASARDPFGAIVAGGIVVALLFQVAVNVGMTMGIAPITGIPLPFVSVGGSSLVANLAAMGVLLSIGARSRTGPRRAR